MITYSAKEKRTTERTVVVGVGGDREVGVGKGACTTKKGGVGNKQGSS